ncbi:MAG: hypothetical protein MUD06_11095, partial [Rhodospirillales bacterium]|nr:hypothetical protein [Rhodospirillales bacterium]
QHHGRRSLQAAKHFDHLAQFMGICRPVTDVTAFSLYLYPLSPFFFSSREEKGKSCDTCDTPT